jgi:hypothetical protein
MKKSSLTNPASSSRWLISGAMLVVGMLGCGEPEDGTNDGAGNAAAAQPSTANPTAGSVGSTAPTTASPTTTTHPAAPSGTAGVGDAGIALGAGPSTAPAAGSADSLWCKAKAVMDARCVACHDGKGTAGTPMGLASYADMMADAPGHAGKKVWERVGVRVHADMAKAEGLSAMPPKNDMTAAQLAAVDAFVAAKAPQGDNATCAAPAGSDTAGTTNPAALGPDGRPVSIWDPKMCDDVYKFVANNGNGGKLPVPFTAGTPDSYNQVPVDAPWGDEEVQVINTRPITDNGKVLHHWILYDRAGPFLTGWAPGDNERQPMPADVGMKMPKGKNSMYIDMHYYNTTGAPAEDASGVELCVVKGKNLRPNPSGITMGFSQLFFSIPAGAKEYTVKGECTIQATKPIHIMSASPHAHRLAKHMKFSVAKKDGSVIQMLDAPFIFGEQASYPLEKEVILETGDKVVTECIYTNDTNAAVTFGEKNSTEMCFNFASYYPVGSFCCQEGGIFEPCGLGGGSSSTGAGGLLGGLFP